MAGTQGSLITSETLYHRAKQDSKFFLTSDDSNCDRINSFPNGKF